MTAPQLTPQPLPQKSEEVRLQKDAAARLNLLADELRNGPVNFTPREGKPILGDQGMAYIAESFAFNERCVNPGDSQGWEACLVVLCSCLLLPYPMNGLGRVCCPAGMTAQRLSTLRSESTGAWKACMPDDRAPCP